MTGVPASPSGSRRSGRASKAVSPPDGASIPNADRFTEHARELIEARLLNHPDEGVRAITAMFGVSDEDVERVAAKLRAAFCSFCGSSNLRDDGCCPDCGIGCGASGMEARRAAAENTDADHDSPTAESGDAQDKPGSRKAGAR